MSFTGSYRDLKTQASSEDPQPNTSFRCWLNRQAKFYYEIMLFTDMYRSVFTFQILLCMFFVHIVYFSSFLLCCNASAFVICAIKNYLLTYLLNLPTSSSSSSSSLARTTTRVLVSPTRVSVCPANSTSAMSCDMLPTASLSWSIHANS